MLFSHSIPEHVFENPHTKAFISVLDALQEYKQEVISQAIRTLNVPLCTDEKWLRKYLKDSGFSDIPSGFPIEPMQQMLLNADTIMSLRGSYIGLELLVSVCALGEVSVDASGLLSKVLVVFPSSTEYGFITDSNDTDHLYLADNTGIAVDSQLSITVSSFYFDGDHEKEMDAIRSYLDKVIKDYVGYSRNLRINWTCQKSTDKVYHRLLGDFFKD